MELFKKTKMTTVNELANNFLFFVDTDILVNREFNEEENEIISDIVAFSDPIVIKVSPDYDENGEFNGNVKYDAHSLKVIRVLINFMYNDYIAKINDNYTLRGFKDFDMYEKSKLQCAPVTIISRYY